MARRRSARVAHDHRAGHYCPVCRREIGARRVAGRSPRIIREGGWILEARTPAMPAPGFYPYNSKAQAEAAAAQWRKGGAETKVRRRSYP